MERLIFGVMLMTSTAGCLNAPPPSAGNHWPPVIGAWFWRDTVLDPDGYRPFLDAVAAQTPYTLLTTSLRISRAEVTDPLVRDQVERAARYARSLGLGIAFDLDLRLARRDFQTRWPDELQEELVLKIVDLPPDGRAEVVFQGTDLTDHMTGGTIPYRCLTTRLVRIYAFERDADGIAPDTLRDVTDRAVGIQADGPNKLTVTVASREKTGVCVIVAHTYLTPDVFAPHLLEFQRRIFRQYADVPLAGVMKDEWGFPPDHTINPAHDRYWYSWAMARAYADRSGGRDLVRDALLMFVPHKGRQGERQAAINRYFALCRERNAQIEDDFHRAAKETFGPAAFVGTHATWTPYPGAQEFRKHGLVWWEATRDVGQSDESTPYPCRTSMAKRWGYPIWYNQFYATRADDYIPQLWAGALAGGRLNVHPLYPRSADTPRDTAGALMQHGLMAGMTRLRMLDFVTRAPLECPVAVVFGHASAMNWAGPSYNRVGLEIASALGAEGYPTDLIPSSLIGASALRLDEEGYVCLGPQRYRAVVLHQPQFGDERELAFFERAARGGSAIFIVGEWTLDSEARPLAAMARLGASVRRCEDDASCTTQVTRFLEQAGVEKVTGWSARLEAWGQEGRVLHAAPPTDGHAVLTDGTYVRIAGSKEAAGDLIRETFTWRGHSVTVDAVGVVAIRFAADGRVDALAAGGLKSLSTKGLEISLPQRTDIAFVAGLDGKLRGVVQGLAGEIPQTLLNITSEWQRLALAPSLPQGRQYP